ncbi:MAG TPA: metallophosphoesterase [Candidatus Angelobacter sp.]|nr:metallophosphoesterase [Candidatus Angelobacter sp.]
MRIAATADIHFTPQSYDRLREPLSHVREEADVLVIAGDLTNYGRPDEMHSLLNALVRLRVPVIAVLGNHDYESGQEQELINLMTAEGIKVLDGSSYERDSVGFAGAKGFLGGFGRGVLTAFGEKEVKAFVQAGIDETMKLERSLSMLRTQKTVIVTHYAPIAETVQGEPSEIWPYLGSSRLSDVIDRHGASLALHGHAHHGKADGKTTGGVPVSNVSLPLLLAQDPPCAYRLFDV